MFYPGKTRIFTCRLIPLPSKILCNSKTVKKFRASILYACSFWERHPSSLHTIWGHCYYIGLCTVQMCTHLSTPLTPLPKLRATRIKSMAPNKDLNDVWRAFQKLYCGFLIALRSGRKAFLDSANCLCIGNRFWREQCFGSPSES